MDTPRYSPGLDKAIERAGGSQEALGKLLGISRAAISSWGYAPNPERCIQIRKLYPEISLAELNPELFGTEAVAV